MSDNEDLEDEGSKMEGVMNGPQGSNSNAGRWTDEEHSKFLEALQLYGKNWNKVHRHVGTRTSA